MDLLVLGFLPMRKVIFESAVSIDGFIEGPNGELDWMVCEEGDGDARPFLSAFDTIFYGRKAYEKFGIAPSCTPELAEAEREFYYAIATMRKYVFSRRKKHVAGNGMVVSENLEAEVIRIRDEEGKNIWLCGGADIFKTFVDLDLIDEYILTVHPVVLNRGKSLFGGIKKPLNLKLVRKYNLRSGVVILHYRPESRRKGE
jgi:dihydrofolate reductase